MRYYLLCEKANYSISENHKFILGTKEKPLVITNKKSEEQYEIKEKVIVIQMNMILEKMNVKKLLQKD